MKQTPLNTEKFQRKAVKVEEAQSRIASYVQQGEREDVGLEQAHGRYLAMDLTAPHPYPRFRRSGMDGYAILASDTEVCSTGQEIWLHVIDEIPCGTVSDKRVETGMAVRIMTGAQLPEGADTVVMLEATQLREENGQTYVGLKKRMEVGKNVTQIGHEIKEGQLLLSKGTCVGAGHVSVLATFGVRGQFTGSHGWLSFPLDQNCSQWMSRYNRGKFETVIHICWLLKLERQEESRSFCKPFMMI